MSPPEVGRAGPPTRPVVGEAGRRRSSAQIRTEIESQRQELSRSVDALRGRVTEITNWRRQVREHRTELVAAAAVAGFVIGGLVALRRRR